jgi:chorismate--pyruvate lyase
MSLPASLAFPHWYTTKQCLISLPDDVKPWLLSQGSLTQQLTRYAEGQFHVQPFSEGFSAVEQHESQLLGTPQYQQAWVREVYLFGSDDMPWVKARSIVPLRTLKGQGLRLRYLGNRSLGSLLFQRTKPDCIRQIARLPEGWARRSLYLWHQQPLIVQEVFLDAFCQRLQQHR